MQRAVRCLAVTSLIASLAVLPVLVVPSRTIWGEPLGEAKATGSLTVKTKPKGARQAGARWRVDGGAWQKSGRTVSGLSVGQHVVTFKPIDGWDTPRRKKPSITADQTATISGKYVLPAVAPIAAFSSDPTSGLVPLEVQFTDESIPGTSPITSWEWDFENDGVVDSVEQHPMHNYPVEGTYDVTLSVTSTSGSNAVTQQALVDVLPVVAAFSASPTTGVAPLEVTFTDESTPGTSPITSWEWDIDNDGVVDSPAQNPVHTYTSPGVYSVTLRANISNGSNALTQHALITVFLAVVGPTAAFSATPTNAPAPLGVQFTDESTPGSSPITSWEWDFNDDGTVDSTEQNPHPTFQSAGMYDVKLTVGSDSGSDSLTKNDYVNANSGNSQIIRLPGNVPVEFVWIPAGSFTMGRSLRDPDSQANENPRHLVSFANGFWIGKFEVTQAQWLAVRSSNPSHFTGNLSRPVDDVSYNNAQLFITLVNELGKGTVRLPSEAEWEYACRAGTTSTYYWGDELVLRPIIGNYAWYDGNSTSTTHPVGQKLPNAWGLYDVSGNVDEWCEDSHHSSYTGAPTDGSAWVLPLNSLKIIRGGSWIGGTFYCRSAYRSYFQASESNYLLGFRLVMSS